MRQSGMDPKHKYLIKLNLKNEKGGGERKMKET